MVKVGAKGVVPPNRLAERAGGAAAVEEAGAVVVPPNKLAERGGGAAAVEAEAGVSPNRLAERGGDAAVEAEAGVSPNRLVAAGGGTPSLCLPATVLFLLFLRLLEGALDAMIDNCSKRVLASTVTHSLLLWWDTGTTTLCMHVNTRVHRDGHQIDATRIVSPLF